MSVGIETHALLAQREDHGGLTLLEIQDELSEYSMPPIRQGEMVSYYPEAHLGGRVEIAFVARCHKDANTIAELYVPLGDWTSASTVPHMSDPRLRLLGSHIENGAWDYMDRHKEELKERKDIIERLERLEAAIKDKPQPHRESAARKSSEPPRNRKPKETQYSIMRTRATELGIPMFPKLSGEELARRIAEEEVKLLEQDQPSQDESQTTSQ